MTDARARLSAIVARTTPRHRWIEETVHHTPRELADDLRAVLADLEEAERLLALVDGHDSNLVDALNGWADRPAKQSEGA